MNFLFVKFRAVCYTRGETKTSDIRMPGMDGMELMQRLNRDHPEIKIVILSGYRTPRSPRASGVISSFG